MRAHRLIAAIVSGMLLAMPAVRAQDDATTAQGVIRAQVEALQRDDAAAAYGFASPQIRELFPQPETFMGMVKSAYPPVYRHKRFEFGASQTMPDGKVAQRVAIIDRDDVAWEALYTLERQADGTLQITGCVLLKVGTAV